MKVLLLLITYFAFSSGKSLPSYLKACSAKDSNFDKCITEQAHIALDHLKDGDKTYNFPSINPLHVDEVEAAFGPKGFLKFTNIYVYGIDKINFDAINWDLDKKEIKLTMTGALVLEGNYEGKGKILMLSMEGKGPGKLSVSATLHQTLPYELVDKDGKKFIKLLGTDTLTTDWKMMEFKLDNLFNGDPVLGPQINTFLNENWRDVIDDIGTPLIQTTGAIIKQLSEHFITSIPYNELLLDA